MNRGLAFKNITKAFLLSVLQSRLSSKRYVRVPEPRYWTAAVDDVSVNAETPPMWGGVSGDAGEPDDYLLSHG